MSGQVRVRFAPSPTGGLHVGSVRTALFNFVFAKKHKGTFILRIEDTDRERSKKEHEDEILRSMDWLGLTYDEGPFYQTQRTEHYVKAATQLLESGHAYKCYCTTEELNEMRVEAESKGLKPMYNRKCRDLPSSFKSDKPYVIRFKIPLDGETIINDLIKGPIVCSHKELDDLIVLRSNGDPTYNLTVVVDDIDMKITHVIRGDDHVANTPKQMLMFQALGAKLPFFAHLPLILGPDKKKLSKRHGDTTVEEYKKQGILKEALINALIRLGWSHGDEEHFTLEKIVELFSLEACGNSPSVFEMDRLKFLNAHYIQQKSKNELLPLIKGITGQDLHSSFDNSEKGNKLFNAVKSRASTLHDFVTAISWYLHDKVEIEDGLEDKVIKKANLSAIAKFKNKISHLSSEAWNEMNISSALKATVEELKIGFGDLAKPIRVYLTGNLSSPDLSLVIYVLGKDRALSRLP